MITKELYEYIKTRYGDVASWAVWEEPGEKPKSNMGYSKIFNLQENPLLLNNLQNNVVMVGLNFSRPIEVKSPFMNFHDLNPRANDFKIRYAFTNTLFYGAYMTDLIKKTPITDSKDLKIYLRESPNVLQENIATFRNELRDIEADQPIILAFGKDVYGVLERYLNKTEYSYLIKLTHYSHFISKEKYKEKVLNQINDVFGYRRV